MSAMHYLVHVYHAGIARLEEPAFVARVEKIICDTIRAESAGDPSPWQLCHTGFQHGLEARSESDRAGDSVKINWVKTAWGAPKVEVTMDCWRDGRNTGPLQWLPTKLKRSLLHEVTP